MQVQWGLAGRQYFDDEFQKIEVEKILQEDESEMQEAAVSSAEEDEPESQEAVVSSVEDRPVYTEKEVTETEEAGRDLEMLIATGRVKNSSPSASAFKKEIIKFARSNREVSTILPMLTNLGVLSREQIYVIGICMDVFKESDRDREKVEAAIDALAGKGYIVSFAYEVNGSEEEVFCLSSYCYGCLKKDSISVQMRGFWGLSFGDVKVNTTGKIEKAVVDKFIRNNKRLAEYLYAAKNIVELKEYQLIKQSIKWENDHYQIAVVEDGETILCRLYDPEAVPAKEEKFDMLLVGEVDDSIKNSGARIFVCKNQSIGEFSGAETDSEAEELFLEESEKGEPEAAEKEENRVDAGENAEKPMMEALATLEMDTEPENPDSQETKEATEKTTGEVTEAAIEETTEEVIEKIIEKKIEETTEEITEETTEEISVKSLIKKSTPPTDREFCVVLEQLLNREVTTKEQFTSQISQTAAFAKAVGELSVKDYPESYQLSARIRLASHLMLNECTYTSEFLSSVFVNPEEEDPVFMLAAYLFAMLAPGMAFDYGLKNQTDLFLERYEDYFGEFAAFKPLFNKMKGIGEVSATGFSPAFVSLLGDEAESERFLNRLCISARECLNVKAPKTRMKALPPMYSACFGTASELYECMSIISENKRDKDDVALVEMILRDYCDEQNGAISLSRMKIEDKLTKAWYEANPKNKFKLEYDARDQALRQFYVRLEIMQAWVEHINNMNNRKQDISRLKTLRAEIIKLIQGIQKDSTWKKQKNANILIWVLYYMQQYLNGQAVELKIYSEFLYTGILTVGNDGVPVIDRNLIPVKYYEPWRRVLKHIVSNKRSLTEVKDEILGNRLDDKADEEGLKDNLHQLEMLGRLLEDTSEDYVITDGQRRDAIESADDRATRFREKLELAYTYNQVNEIQKETLLGIVNQYKAGFYEAGDFACWRRFLEALEMQITEFAKDRKRQLRARLDERLRENPESSLLNEANRLLENEMNFAVTEEYINRFEAGESILYDNADLHDIDYFSDFLEPGHFDPLLQECRRCNGKSLSVFGWNYIERKLPKDWTVRQREDSRSFVTNWPKRKGAVTPAQIKALFSGLGFDVKAVERVTGKKEEVFKIGVVRTAKSMADYRHPIAAFGTQIKSPINAIVLFGNYTEKQLVDTVSSLDLGGISIVLLDRPVDAASRRLIGEIFHTQTSGQNPFLLIDQVLLLYLALHQITERMPAMLKCTLPYSTYQPFVRDGGSTSDEMFCGRTQELATIIDPNGACVVYGGRQLGKTALLERAESRISKPENKAFAVYSTIVRLKNEKEVVESIVSDINKKVDGKITVPECDTLKKLCVALGDLFRSGKVVSMLLLIDEVDDFLASIADEAYRPIQPLVDLKRETKNNFKFVIAGLHNVCRAKNATRDNGIFGQLGTPLCIKPLSPTDALQLLSRPLRYLGFQIDRYPHLETILTNTNYYPGILQFFGYMLVETLTGQYSKYYRAVDGNPPFTLQDEQLGAVMNSSDLNKSIKDKFRWSLELDQRYFMLARCITMLYHYYEEDRKAGTWMGFPVDEIMQMAEEYGIHCLENESRKDYINLLDEMVEMGILSKPDEKRDLYRLRRNSFVDIIGENIDILDVDITSNNEEVQNE